MTKQISTSLPLRKKSDNKFFICRSAYEKQAARQTFATLVDYGVSTQAITDIKYPKTILSLVFNKVFNPSNPSKTVQVSTVTLRLKWVGRYLPIK